MVNVLLAAVLLCSFSFGIFGISIRQFGMKCPKDDIYVGACNGWDRNSCSKALGSYCFAPRDIGVCCEKRRTDHVTQRARCKCSWITRCNLR